jgi:Co/Zn/Cd efflux system component
MRRVLFIALAINAGMFGVEISAGLVAQSVALQADALDFLGDAATYGITLFVLGMSLRWRAAAALLKGVSMGLFGVFVLGAAIYHIIGGTLPGAGIMGSVGFAALVANVICALMLIGFREGDANMRSVWLCSRNDAIGNVAVMAAAAGVFATDTGWPDVGVAALMAALAFTASWQVTRQALRELRAGRLAPVSG